MAIQAWSGVFMSVKHKFFLVGVILLTVVSSGAFAQSFPKRYSGELNVCDKVSADVKTGKSVESALVDSFISYSDQSVQDSRSIQRAIVYSAIQACHYDGGDVVRAAIRIDMNLPLLVLSLSESGLGLETLRDALHQAGVSSAAIDGAIEAAMLEGGASSKSDSSALPPPFEVLVGGGSSGTAVSGGGLGQASPYIP
jgi:hypothetical protein